MPVGEMLRSGFVEDIHVNGPNIYAQEIYVLNGAKPGTTYQVSLHIYAHDTTCKTVSTDDLEAMTAPNLTTNAAGNGKAQAVFQPSGVPPALRNGTRGVIWTVSDSSGVAFNTLCTAVALD